MGEVYLIPGQTFSVEKHCRLFVLRGKIEIIFYIGPYIIL